QASRMGSVSSGVPRKTMRMARARYRGRRRSATLAAGDRMPLLDEFIAAASPDAFSPGPGVEAALRALYRRGRAAHPDLGGADERWARDLGRRAGDRERDL